MQETETNNSRLKQKLLDKFHSLFIQYHLANILSEVIAVLSSAYNLPIFSRWQTIGPTSIIQTYCFSNSSIYQATIFFHCLKTSDIDKLIQTIHICHLEVLHCVRNIFNENIFRESYLMTTMFFWTPYIKITVQPCGPNNSWCLKDVYFLSMFENDVRYHLLVIHCQNYKKTCFCEVKSLYTCQLHIETDVRNGICSIRSSFLSFSL